MATLLEQKPADLQALPWGEVESKPPAADAFAGLAAHNYIRLTTFRKSGQAVYTPVWFVAEGGWLFVRTSIDSGKVKRLRNNSWLLVTPSNPIGKPLGSAVAATARLLLPSEQAWVARAFLQKYGWQLRFFDQVLRLRGHQQDENIYLEIAP